MPPFSRLFIAAHSSVKDLSEYGRVTGEHICIVAEREKNTKSDKNGWAVSSHSNVWFLVAEVTSLAMFLAQAISYLPLDILITKTSSPSPSVAAIFSPAVRPLQAAFLKRGSEFMWLLSPTLSN